MALPQPLEPELLEHLRVEFGQHGHRAADLLEDAHAQLVAGTPLHRLREIVAHCLREAMTAILDSVDSGEVGKWRDLSREVVKARRRYGMAVGLPGADAEGALRDLLARIDDLSRFHDQGQGLHERRLIAVVVRRTGAEPLSAGTEPVRAYQDLVGRLSARRPTVPGRRRALRICGRSARRSCGGCFFLLTSGVRSSRGSHGYRNPPRPTRMRFLASCPVPGIWATSWTRSRAPPGSKC